MKHLLVLAAATFIVLAPSINAQDEEDSIQKIQSGFQAAGQADDKIDAKEMKEFAGRALALAKQKGGRTGYQATLWTLYICKVAEADAQAKSSFRTGATDIIVERYANSSSIGELLAELEAFDPAEAKQCEACIARIEAAATKPKAKDAIRAYRLRKVIFETGSITTPEARKAAIASLEAQIKEAGDKVCPFDYANPKRTWKAVAAGPLFELKNLYIGAEAPDIKGVDVDGVSFSLSDYRGKVIFLDFWGHW
jgi:hypothetical protein